MLTPLFIFKDRKLEIKKPTNILSFLNKSEFKSKSDYFVIKLLTYFEFDKK